MKYLATFGFLIGALLIISGVVFGRLKSSVIGPTLSSLEAEKKFGKLEFSETKFKVATMAERAKMAGDLVRKKVFVGKPFSEVKNQLGNFTGYFWNDMFPTYLISEGTEANRDAWQIVFLPGKGNTVSDIVINKNCCD